MYKANWFFIQNRENNYLIFRKSINSHLFGYVDKLEMRSAIQTKFDA